MKNFKKNDKVEIIGNIPFDLLTKKRPLIGTVTEIDGFYIYVRPKYQRYICEFYASELKHLEENIRYMRKMKLKKIQKSIKL